MSKLKKNMFIIISVFAIAGLGGAIGWVIFVDPFGEGNPPGTFQLLYNLDSPNSDGNITLTWTEASKAENYTVFTYPTPITQFNDSLITLGTTDSTTNTWHTHNLTNGDYYFIILATNEFGASYTNLLFFEVFIRPGLFILSSHENDPEIDGTFLLSWTTAERAKNYTVYSFNDRITSINGSLTDEGTTTTANFLISNKTLGTHHFRVLATSLGGGTTLSSELRPILVQNGWSWNEGSNTTNSKTVVEIPYVPHAMNNPGARIRPALWDFPNDDFYLLGGLGYDEMGISGYLNDLWFYDNSSELWTYVNGSLLRDIGGIYGTKGVAAPSNYPGGRNGMQYWADSIGNLWIFGGDGIDSAGTFGWLDDVWMFNTTSSEWKWVAGSNLTNAIPDLGGSGVYGSTYTPGSRRFASTWKVDDDLLIFGGEGVNSVGSHVFLNNIWTFNTKWEMWAYVTGDIVGNTYGDYNNYPGSRRAAAIWKRTDDIVWIFGGEGYDKAGSKDQLNDLWTFNMSNLEWKYRGGSDLVGNSGSYANFRQFSTSAYPSARSYSQFTKDELGRLWLYGGYGVGDTSLDDFLNDVWVFDPSVNLWAWMLGNNTANSFANYGLIGEISEVFTPGGRAFGKMWLNSKGNLMYFGGRGFHSEEPTGGYFNDIWEYHRQE